MNFNDYPIGTEFLCIKGFWQYLNEGEVYITFRDCTGRVSILDNRCKLNEYEAGWSDSSLFILNSPAMKILHGV